MKRASKTSPCYWHKETPWKFLWWHGTTHDSGYEHDWIYTDKEHRECRRCGEKEVLFGTQRYYQDYEDYGNYTEVEDWRLHK